VKSQVSRAYAEGRSRAPHNRLVSECDLPSEKAKVAAAPKRLPGRPRPDLAPKRPYNRRSPQSVLTPTHQRRHEGSSQIRRWICDATVVSPTEFGLFAARVGRLTTDALPLSTSRVLSVPSQLVRLRGRQGELSTLSAFTPSMSMSGGMDGLRWSSIFLIILTTTNIGKKIDC
jgi:hypothetical protein